MEISQEGELALNGLSRAAFFIPEGHLRKFVAWLNAVAEIHGVGLVLIVVLALHLILSCSPETLDWILSLLPPI